MIVRWIDVRGRVKQTSELGEDEDFTTMKCVYGESTKIGHGGVTGRPWLQWHVSVSLQPEGIFTKRYERSTLTITRWGAKRWGKRLAAELRTELADDWVKEHVRVV